MRMTAEGYYVLGTELTGREYKGRGSAAAITEPHGGYCLEANEVRSPGGTWCRPRLRKKCFLIVHPTAEAGSGSGTSAAAILFRFRCWWLSLVD